MTGQREQTTPLTTDDDDYMMTIISDDVCQMVSVVVQSYLITDDDKSLVNLDDEVTLRQLVDLFAQPVNSSTSRQRVLLKVYYSHLSTRKCQLNHVHLSPHSKCVPLVVLYRVVACQ